MMRWELSWKIIIIKLAIAFAPLLLSLILVLFVWNELPEIILCLPITYVGVMYLTIPFCSSAIKMIGNLKIVRRLNMEEAMCMETPYYQNGEIFVSDSFIWSRRKNYCLPLKYISCIRAKKYRNRYGTWFNVYVRTPKGYDYCFASRLQEDEKTINAMAAILLQVNKRAPHVRHEGFNLGHTFEALWTNK